MNVTVYFIIISIIIMRKQIKILQEILNYKSLNFRMKEVNSFFFSFFFNSKINNHHCGMKNFKISRNCK
jgi:3-phenylpropionate/cinnamic acid dioxygenase small subunit